MFPDTHNLVLCALEHTHNGIYLSCHQLFRQRRNNAGNRKGANTIMFFTFGFQFVYSTLYMAIGQARQSLLLNIGRQGLFFIPAILLLPSYWGLNGVLYAQPVADVFATLMTLFFAIQIHKEIGHKSHLITENLQC